MKIGERCNKSTNNSLRNKNKELDYNCWVYGRAKVTNASKPLAENAYSS